jgi:hypothetical protein
MNSKTHTNPTFSRALDNECRKNKLKVKEKAFADLLAIGWKDRDAYIVTNLYNPIYSPERNWADMNRLLTEDKKFTDYYHTREKQLRRKPGSGGNHQPSTAGTTGTTADTPPADTLSNISKEAQLKELIQAKALQTIGSREWIDISKMIADITGVKKEETPTEDNTIHYYLPLSCNNCSLYMAAKSKKNRRNQPLPN